MCEVLTSVQRAVEIIVRALVPLIAPTVLQPLDGLAISALDAGEQQALERSPEACAARCEETPSSVPSKERMATTPGGGGAKAVCRGVRGEGNVEQVDTTDIELEDGRSRPVVNEVVYLGAVIHESLDDRHAVEARVKKASQICGMLRKPILGKKGVPMRTKKLIYETYVISTLLYGCECWSLSESTYDRLRTFQRGRIKKKDRRRTR